ncbi:hypothetical protein ACS0TY_036422 [Phlomoides rotata]
MVVVLLCSSCSGQENEGEALLKFKGSLQVGNAGSLSNWIPLSAPPCSGNTANWEGVSCMDGYVSGVLLEKMNLRGQIDVHSLASLRFLRKLSFMGNSFDGAMPDWRKIGALKSLFLSNNKFSGPIAPDAFKGMTSLKRLHLANNNFTGPLPTSLQSPKLFELKLENNRFTGPIPKISSESLKIFNVANNLLEGNKALCGKPLQTECDLKVFPPPSSPDAAADVPPPSPPPTSPPSKPTALIVVSAVVALFLIVLVLVHVKKRRSSHTQLGRTVSPLLDRERSMDREGVPTTLPVAVDQIKMASKKSEQGHPGKLSFVREDRHKFDLQDLMRASAEVLGSGNFGASYKAVLVDGDALVVKRFKQMNNIEREDFHEHMRRLGRLSHQNLLPLVAYLYRKEEKLLVFDFVANGSLATHLHGKHSAVLNWSTRLKIIKGVGKGLMYLQNEVPTLNIPHGHLKSSNILLDKDFNPLLMDYALAPIVNSNELHNVLFAYKSPEYATLGRVTKKTDVWCLGTLILETLTGRYLAQGSTADVAAWINRIAAEEYANVFDKEMDITKESRPQMEKLLQIGIACCQDDADKRWDLDEALRQIDQIHNDDNDQLLLSIST